MKRLPTRDFRSLRHRLEAKDFALPGSASLPPDLIERAAWEGLVVLPDDVAIYTSSHCGTRLTFLCDLWADWLKRLVSHRGDLMLASAMLDAADDFSVSTFTMMHGYYKQSIAALRSAVELMMLAATCTLHKRTPLRRAKWNPEKSWQDWETDSSRIEVNRIADQLNRWATQAEDAVRGREASNTLRVSRDLYARLNRFCHARSSSSNVTLWRGSNGPVFDLDAFREASELQIETYCVLYRLIKLARPRFRIVRVLSREIAVTSHLS
jgi:hypothetical protein